MISVITLEVFWDKRFLYAQIMSIEETKTILWKSKLLKNLIINISMGLNLVKTSQNADVYINQNYKGWSINEGWELKCGNNLIKRISFMKNNNIKTVQSFPTWQYQIRP